MAKKIAQRAAPRREAPLPKEGAKKFASFRLEIASMPRLTPYLPGILLFIIALIVALLTYKDYGVAWDEHSQIKLGTLTWDYIFDDSQAIFYSDLKSYGSGFELVLLFIQKIGKIEDAGQVMLMRHLVTHLLFLVGALSLYVLAYRLFRSRWMACLAFMMLILTPRIYAHSYFNSKDVPFLSMFIISFTLAQLAFEKNKRWLFLWLGLACGYATSIRVMGIMLFTFMLILIGIDILRASGRERTKALFNLLFFSLGFSVLLYIAWPLLWSNPIKYLIGSIREFSYYPWNGYLLLHGQSILATSLPWYYFPAWFLITVPEVWLLAGFAGLVLISVSFFKKPLAHLANTRERHFILYTASFFAPIFATIFLHSIIYDDWRHLYFIYPSFILLGLYCIDRLVRSKYKYIVAGVCALQLVFLSFFVVTSHPFLQVYFNNFVSHAPGSLGKNYDLDYWGCSFRQGIEYLLQADKSASIKVNSDYPILLKNNMMLLDEDDRKRITIADRQVATYLITNFRQHPYDYPSYKLLYSIRVLNSDILRIYELPTEPQQKNQAMTEEIAILNRFITKNPAVEIAYVNLGCDYYWVNQFDSGEKYTRRALEIVPDDNAALNNLAGLYFATKKNKELIETLRKIIVLDSTDDKAEANLGNAYYRQADYDSARVHNERAVLLNPANRDAMNNLGGVFFFKKDYPRAIAYFKKEGKLKPGDPMPDVNIALCFLKLNVPDSSILYARAAMSMGANNNMVYEQLANAYNAKGNADSAKKYEALAQKFNPGFRL